jgi:hypothetical protein
VRKAIFLRSSRNIDVENNTLTAPGIDYRTFVKIEKSCDEATVRQINNRRVE